MKLFPLSGIEPDTTASAYYRLYDMKDTMTAVIRIRPPGGSTLHCGLKAGSFTQSPS